MEKEQENSMELVKLSECIWYGPYEDERDRPVIGYVKGSRYSLAVEAGHSERHLLEFYDALEKEGLKLPDFTVVSHWHWDHTLAMPYVHGVTIAEKRTQRHLLEMMACFEADHGKGLWSFDPCVHLEYAEGEELKACGADLVFDDRMRLDLGGVHVSLIHGPSPHTDDCVYILVEEEKVLFTGDAQGGIYPTWKCPRPESLEACRFLETLDFETAVGGHWPIVDKEGLIRFIKGRISE